MHVLFGSQSGTAQSIAFGFSLSAQAHLADNEVCHVRALNEIADSVDTLVDTPAVFVVSNFGTGEPPGLLFVKLEAFGFFVRISLAQATFCP